MTSVHPRHINSSISPVSRHDANQTEASMEQKVLVEAEVELENLPVPEAHEEVRQPRIGRKPMAPTKAEIEERLPTPQL